MNYFLLLKQLNPKIAIVSTGYNSYGHPSDKTIELLKLNKIKTYRTDYNNAIKVILTNDKTKLYTYKNSKKRFKDFNLTLEYLKQLWEEQKGICPYTGIQLCLAEYKANHNDPIYTASLDRIDSSKGYTIGNVQFISTAINYMKNTMSHEETINLCNIIAKHVVELGAYDSPVQTTI